MSTLDNLKKSARRWLNAVRAGDANALARLTRAYPNAPAKPVLRDIQHAVAREHGHQSWRHLRAALDATPGAHAAPDLDQYEGIARDVLAAYHAADAEALQRLAELAGRPLTHAVLRSEIDSYVAQLPESEKPTNSLTLAYVRHFIATTAGFQSWPAFVETLNLSVVRSAPVARPTLDVPMEPNGLSSTGMLQPLELRRTLPIELQDGLFATTTEVWQMLVAAHDGDLERITTLTAAVPALVRCEYNYMPPLHLAVREGHVEVVRYLLQHGAYDPDHVTYPYNEKLVRLAEDRNYSDIASLLREYEERPAAPRSGGRPVHGAGTIEHPRDPQWETFRKLVDANALAAVEAMLDRDAGLVHEDPGGEGILSGPANRRRWKMLELLIRYGARVPDVAKWGRAYYLKHHDVAAFLLERGMNPNHTNWHRTTLLHDMAWEGDLRKARLLLDHGAAGDSVDDEFRSTPLGLAARWGRRDLARLLVDWGADPSKSGAPWATPLAWAAQKRHADIASDLRAAGAV